MADQQVFISYAWGGESEIVANEIEALLAAKTVRLVRDKTDLGFKGLISEFMEQIGQGNLVVLIISDKYLKSKNCMFELLEVAKKGEFHSRIFPVVLTDANIYDALGLIDYLEYWQKKINELNARIKELENLADTRRVMQDIDLYTDIRAAIDDLAGKISNMNTLTLEIMRAQKYQPLLEALGEKLNPPSLPAGPSKKEGKVLYHIPGMMQINAWTRCTVRLAWEEILLSEGLDIPKEELEIESIRLANIMQVSLVEGKKGANFEISPINNEEQFIDEGDFTEWLFDVKPLTIGNFTLILRITLIQLIEGQERKKDIVLEREVTTETVVPKALQKFETAEDGLSSPVSILESTNNKAKGVTDDKTSFDRDSIFGEKSKKLNLDNVLEKKPAGISNSSPPPSMPRNVGHSPLESPPQPAGMPKIPMPAPASPKQNRQETSTSPPKRRSTKWLVPFTASAAAFLLIAMFFYPRIGSESSDPDFGALPDEIAVGAPAPSMPSAQEKTVLILSRYRKPNNQQSTAPIEPISRNLIFIVNEDQLDSLSKLNFGAYDVQAIPISDTLNYNLGDLKEYTVREIQDSLNTMANWNSSN